LYSLRPTNDRSGTQTINTYINVQDVLYSKSVAKKKQHIFEVAVAGLVPIN